MSKIAVKPVSDSTITVLSDTDFMAIFDMMHTISVLANDNTRGNVIGSGTYPQDSITTIGAVPNVGHRFFKWDDGNTDNPRTITVTADMTFTAIFEIIYTVNVLANDDTKGSVSGGGIYPKDSIAIISATANTDYFFLKWNDGNTDNPRTITVTYPLSLLFGNTSI